MTPSEVHILYPRVPQVMIEKRKPSTSIQPQLGFFAFLSLSLSLSLFTLRRAHFFFFRRPFFLSFSLSQSHLSCWQTQTLCHGLDRGITFSLPPWRRTQTRCRVSTRHSRESGWILGCRSVVLDFLASLKSAYQRTFVWILDWLGKQGLTCNYRASISLYRGIWGWRNLNWDRLLPFFSFIPNKKKSYMSTFVCTIVGQ